MIIVFCAILIITSILLSWTCTGGTWKIFGDDAEFEASKCLTIPDTSPAPAPAPAPEQEPESDPVTPPAPAPGPTPAAPAPAPAPGPPPSTESDPVTPPTDDSSESVEGTQTSETADAAANAQGETSANDENYVIEGYAIKK